jgi:CheY-like chemotaxis protein
MATAHSAGNSIPAAETQILVVEDEEAILDLAVSILRDEGYRVTSAINGDVALVILQQGLPFRLLITDIAMPGLLDGYALARKARELQPDDRQTLDHPGPARRRRLRHPLARLAPGEGAMFTCRVQS